MCENLHLSRNTRFLAMLLVDHFMDKHIVMDYRLKLVALTCLLVAGELLFNSCMAIVVIVCLHAEL